MKENLLAEYEIKLLQQIVIGHYPTISPAVIKAITYNAYKYYRCKNLEQLFMVINSKYIPKHQPYLRHYVKHSVLIASARIPFRKILLKFITPKVYTQWMH